MAFGEIDRARQLKIDQSRTPFWYGVRCGQGRFLEGRVDFLVNAGGFDEASKLIDEYPDIETPSRRAFYLTSRNAASVFDELFGSERMVIRVMNVEAALADPLSVMLVLPVLSQRWNDRTSRIPPGL